MIRYFLLFSALFFALGLGILEFHLRSLPPEAEIRVMECLKLGGPEHHTFIPDCRSNAKTPIGSVEYRINEDGFRADPRAAYKGGAVALLGDSKVEGWWLQQEGTVGAELEAMGVFGGWKELNLGIRFSGPTIQRMRLVRAFDHYPLKAVIWFLNGTDPADERLADSLTLARDKFGAPSELSHADVESPGWLQILQNLTHHRSALLQNVQMRLYDREVLKRVVEAPSDTGIPCVALHSGLESLRAKKIPVVAVLLPLGPNIAKFPYMNLVGDDEGADQMAACIHAEKIAFIDMRGKLDSNPEYYWSNHRNMTAAGMRHLVTRLEPLLRTILQGLKSGVNRRFRHRSSDFGHSGISD